MKLVGCVLVFLFVAVMLCVGALLMIGYCVGVCDEMNRRTEDEYPAPAYTGELDR